LRYVTGPGRQDVWLSGAGAAADGTVIGVVPPSIETWVMAFQQSGRGPSKLSWRERVIVYLYQHRHSRLADRLRRPTAPIWAPANNPGLVLSLEMRGTKLK
jgi:hypothetical protein